MKLIYRRFKNPMKSLEPLEHPKSSLVWFQVVMWSPGKIWRRTPKTCLSRTCRATRCASVEFHREFRRWWCSAWDLDFSGDFSRDWYSDFMGLFYVFFFLNVCVFGFKWGCKSTKICPGKLRDYIWWKIYQFTNVTNLPITKMWFLIFSMGHPLGYFHRVIFLGAPSAPPSWSKRPLLTISSSHHIKHMYAGWKSAWMGMSWRRYPQCWLNH